MMAQAKKSWFTYRKCSSYMQKSVKNSAYLLRYSEFYCVIIFVICDFPC